MNGLVHIGSITAKRYYLIFAITLACLFALITRETARVGLLVHVAQWIAQTVIAFGMMTGAHMLLARWSGYRVLNPWLAFLLSGVLASVFFSFPSLGIDFLVGADPYPATVGEWWRVWLDELEGVVWPVCAAWMVANAPWLLGFRMVAPAMNPEASPGPIFIQRQEPESEPPPFAKLVHPSAWGTLHYLKAELQYIRVVTDKGESLILYSLRDAVSELPPESGMQVHRSYWVARRVIRHLQVRGRQGVVVLDNGVKLPVSRGKIKQVKQALERGAPLLAYSEDSKNPGT